MPFHPSLFFEFLASQEAGDGDREWPLNYMAFLRLSWFPRDVIFLNHPFDFLSLSPSWQTSFPSGQILYCLRQEWSGGCFFDLSFSFYWNNIRNRALFQRLLHEADNERQSVSGVTLSPHLDFVFIPLLSSQHLTQIKRWRCREEGYISPGFIPSVSSSFSLNSLHSLTPLNIPSAVTSFPSYIPVWEWSSLPGVVTASITEEKAKSSTDFYFCITNNNTFNLKDGDFRFPPRVRTKLRDDISQVASIVWLRMKWCVTP